MAVPLIGTGVAAGRGLLAYLAKRKAMRAAQKSALSQIGRYGATVPNAAKFAVKPRGVNKFAKRMGIGGLAAGSFIAGDEYGKRHPRVEAMEDLRIPNAGRVGGPSVISKNGQDVTTDGRIINKSDAAPAFPTIEEIRARVNEINNLNVSEGAKEVLRDDLRKRRVYGNDYLDRISREDASGNLIEETGAGVTEQEYYNLEKALREKTGAAYTGDELNTFMGMPLKEKLAEWNAPEGVFPRFFIDQLINNKTITEDDVIDLQAPDGDSFKIIPRGRGRLDKYRKLV